MITVTKKIDFDVTKEIEIDIWDLFGGSTENEMIKELIDLDANIADWDFTFKWLIEWINYLIPIIKKSNDGGIANQELRNRFIEALKNILKEMTDD